MINVSDRKVKTLILLFIVVNIVLLASSRLLPFIDLPNHLAEATIFKYHEPGNLLSRYYSPTPWYFPNTFHTIFCSLFPSVEWGNKVFHILYLIALQVSVYLVVRELNGNPWYGFLAATFTYNYNLTYGFVGFAISLPTLIFLFYAILLYIKTGKFFLNFVIATILVLLFFMHAQNALMGLVIYGFMMLYHFRGSIGKLFLHAVLIPLPLVILIFTWWYSRTPEQEDQNTFEYLIDYYQTSYFQEFLIRFRIAVFDNFQLQEGVTGLIIAVFFFLCLLIPYVVALLDQTKLSTKLSPGLIYAGILLLITSSCYIFSPDKLPGQTPLFQRFGTMVILSFIIFGSIILNDYRKTWLKYFAVTTVGLYTVLWTEYITTFNRQASDFTPQLFAEVAPRNTLAGLIYDNDYRGRKVYIHFPNYYLVWQRGIAASKIIDYRFGVVRRAGSETSLPFYHELIGDAFVHEPKYQTVDYLLVRGDAPVKSDPNLANFSLRQRSGGWGLYHNNNR